MKRVILVLAMLALVTVMALPATAQGWGGNDDRGWSGDDNRGWGGNDGWGYDDGYDRGGYDRGGYDDYDYGQGGYDNWWNWFYDEDSCDWYWSISGPQYWCWSPVFGWYELG